MPCQHRFQSSQQMSTLLAKHREVAPNAVKGIGFRFAIETARNLLPNAEPKKRLSLLSDCLHLDWYLLHLKVLHSSLFFSQKFLILQMMHTAECLYIVITPVADPSITHIHLGRYWYDANRVMSFSPLFRMYHVVCQLLSGRYMHPETLAHQVECHFFIVYACGCVQMGLLDWLRGAGIMLDQVFEDSHYHHWSGWVLSSLIDSSVGQQLQLSQIQSPYLKGIIILHRSTDSYEKGSCANHLTDPMYILMSLILNDYHSSRRQVKGSTVLHSSTKDDLKVLPTVVIGTYLILHYLIERGDLIQNFAFMNSLRSWLFAAWNARALGGLLLIILHRLLLIGGLHNANRMFCQQYGLITT